MFVTCLRLGTPSQAFHRAEISGETMKRQIVGAMGGSDGAAFSLPPTKSGSSVDSMVSFI